MKQLVELQDTNPQCAVQVRATREKEITPVMMSVTMLLCLRLNTAQALIIV